MIEGTVNRIWVPCEDQPNTKQQVDIHQRQELEHYLHSYIKINSLDYEQQLKLKERHLEQ
jgi:hypothetical protein